MKKLICSVLIVLVVLFSFPSFSYGFVNANNPDLYSHDVDINPLIKQAFLDNQSIVYFYNPSDSKYYLYLFDYNSSWDIGYYPDRGGPSWPGCIFIGYAGVSGIYYSWSSGDSSYLTHNTYSPLRVVDAIILASYFPRHPDDNSYIDCNGSSYGVNTLYNLAPCFELSPTEGLVTSDDPSDEPSGTVTVDMTGTNNRLDSIKSVVDDVADDVSTIKSNFSTLLTDIGVIKTSTSLAASDVGTIKSDLSTSKGYIDTIKNDVAAIKTAFYSFVSSDISTIKSGISSINSDLNTKLTAVITALGDVQTAVAAVPTGINSRLDTVNQNLVYIYQALVKQYTGLNDYSTVYQEFVVTQGRLETIAYKIEAFQDLFGNFAGAVFSPFIDPEEEKLSIYENMVAAFSDKFEMLYNVILYGDKNGAEAQQLEQMKMKQFQADLDSITVRLDDAPSAINSNAADVSAEISVFTQFYEGITALNAALSSVLYFGLIVIFIKKVVGR